MTFVNGELQAQFMARIRGLDPQRCLVIPVDVGKAIAVALVADHYGEIVVAPFEFALTETGFVVLSAAISRAQHERDALVIRVGVEAAGHYHRTLVARLRAAGLEVVELNPRAVKDARGQQLLRTLKNDARDCGAMAELLIRGSGRPPQCRDEALAAQAAWVAHRRRKVAAQATLANQIHGQLDLIFPGLTGCFTHGLDAASLRVLIRDLPDPTGFVASVWRGCCASFVAAVCGCRGPRPSRSCRRLTLRFGCPAANDARRWSYWLPTGPCSRPSTSRSTAVPRTCQDRHEQGGQGDTGRTCRLR